MAIEKVREYLREKGMEDRVIEFTVSSATVELAAAALGCEGAMIAKTLSFYLDDGAVLIVCAGDAKVANAAYKAKFGTKARMLCFEDVEPMIGHAVGGVCPFAINAGVKVYLDKSLLRFQTVYPAAGSASSAVKLTPDELYSLSGAIEWVDVCQGWQ